MWLTFFDVADFDVAVINIHMERFFATYNFKNWINNLYFKNIDNLSYEDIILKNHTKKTSKSWKRLKLDHLIYVTWHLGSNKKLLKQRTGFIKHRHYANFDDNRELVNLLIIFNVKDTLNLSDKAQIKIFYCNY